MMTEDRGGAATEGEQPRFSNDDLLAEVRWIAQQTGVVRRIRAGDRAGEWEPDLDQLGDDIGRSTGTFKALQAGGDPELLTLRLLARFAQRKIAGYNPTRLGRALNLFDDEQVVRYVEQELAGDLRWQRIMERIRSEGGFSEAHEQLVLRVVDAVIRAVLQGDGDAEAPPSAGPSPRPDPLRHA